MSASRLGQDPTHDADGDSSDSDNDNDHDHDDNGSSSTGSNAKEQEEEKITLAKNETIAVVRLRLCVFFVLLMAAIAVSVIVYYTTSTAETKESESQYEGAAEKVIQAFLDIVDSKLATVSSVGVTAIAYGIDQQRDWPFVTLSSFQQRAATVIEESGALYLDINPMVSESDRQEWEKYVVGNNSNWM
jgi:hypothetical protein